MAENLTTEATGKQDLLQAVTLGAINTAFGVFEPGAPSNGLLPGYTPNTAALLGSGTLEGTNPYSPPISALAVPGAILPGYGRPWPGTYDTYRAMSAHPTLVLAMAAVMCPILSCEWSIEASKDAPGDAQQFISDMLLPMRPRILWECLKSLAMGCRQFEKVWEIKKGYLSLKRLKPLLPELTEIIVDQNGHFAGLKQGGVTLSADKAFVCTNDRDGDDYYGRSRHENCRRAWSNWLSDSDNMHRLGTKTASIIPQVGYPPCKAKDENGTEKTGFELAKTIAQGMAQGRAVVFPNLANMRLEDMDPKSMADMAKASLWSINTIDMGNSGPSQVALIEQLKYWDMQLVRGWMRPERSLLEAQNSGSRADSESHTDIGLADSDAIHGQIVEQLTEQVVDDLLVQNYGESARGSVRLTAAPLVDAQKLIDQKLLDAVLANGASLSELVEHLDMDAWLDRTGLPRNELQGPWDGLMIPPPTAPGETQLPKEPDSGEAGIDGPLD